jgi:predicted SAM-dependent methyltransferase
MMNLQTAEQLLRGNGRLRQLARDWKNRFPAATSVVRRALWKRRRPAEIRRYFAGQPIVKIQVGTGPYTLPGWLNTDLEPYMPGVIFLDATEPLPFMSRSVDIIYSEHMIEHIDYPSGAKFLRECFRVMKPGGQLRIATPNLRSVLRLYTDPSDPDVPAYLNSTWYNDLPAAESRRCAVLNCFVRAWGHQFIYDAETLRISIESAGFANVRQCEVGESEHVSLRQLESHGQQIGDFANGFETMVLEATRPASIAP